MRVQTEKDGRANNPTHVHNMVLPRTHPKPALVTFDANGGTGTIPLQTIDYEQGTLEANTFTRPGYKFKGWAKADGPSIVAYSDKQTVKWMDLVGE